MQSLVNKSINALKVLVHCCIVLKTSQKVPSLEACKYGLICNLLNRTIYISNFITPRIKIKYDFKYSFELAQFCCSLCAKRRLNTHFFFKQVYFLSSKSNVRNLLQIMSTNRSTLKQTNTYLFVLHFNICE